MNKGLLNDKKYLINTHISKKLSVNEEFINKIFERYEKEEYANKKMKQLFNIVSEKIKIDLNKINVDDTNKKEENNVIDNCYLLDELNYQIKKYRKKNKENNKKIKIENEKKNNKNKSKSEDEKEDSENMSCSSEYSYSSFSESSNESYSESYDSSNSSNKSDDDT